MSRDARACGADLRGSAAAAIIFAYDQNLVDRDRTTA